MDINNIIQLRNFNYQYPDGTSAIKDLSIEINRGDRVALLGPNGAGKSTLFLLLNGILKPKTGEYYLNNIKKGYSKKELIELRREVGVVFQEPDSQLFAPTVYEELSFGPLNLGLSNKEVKNRIESVLEILDISEYRNKPPHLLSYGQKKLVAIGSVLTMNPSLLVLDEPSSGLDAEHADKMLSVLDDLHKNGTSIIMSTHDVNFAWQWADKVMLIKNGTILYANNTADVFSKKELLAECGLKQPMIVQLYQSIKKKKIDTLIPKTTEELSTLINSL